MPASSSFPSGGLSVIQYIIHIDGTPTTCASSWECDALMQKQPGLFTSLFQPSTIISGDLLSISQDLVLSDTVMRILLPYCTQDMWLGSSQFHNNSTSSSAFQPTTSTSSLLGHGDDNWWTVWSQLDIKNARVLLVGGGAGATAAARFAAIMSTSGELAARNVRISLVLDSAWVADYRGAVSSSLPGSEMYGEVVNGDLTSGESDSVLEWWHASPVMSKSELCNENNDDTSEDFSAFGSSDNSTFGEVPCCLDIGCMLIFISARATKDAQGFANLTGLGLDGVFIIASLYDPWVLQLWQARNPIQAQTFSTQLDSVSEAVPIITVLEQYGGLVRQTLVDFLDLINNMYGGIDSNSKSNCSKVWSRVTIFAPSCIQSMWLQPYGGMISTTVITPFQYTQQEGLWDKVSEQGYTLQQALMQWLQWLQANTVNTTENPFCIKAPYEGSAISGNGSEPMSFISTCYGAGCSLTCPSTDVVQSITMDSYAWADMPAIGMLILVGSGATVCVMTVAIILFLVARFRTRVGWKRKAKIKNGASNYYHDHVYDATSKPTIPFSPSCSRPLAQTEMAYFLSSLERLPANEQVRISCHKMTYWAGENRKGSRPILDNISLTINPGEVTALMGVSGCGKTTLLEILGLRRTHGTLNTPVFVNGLAYPQGHSYRRSLAYVRQEGGGFLAHLTVLDNMMYASLLRHPMLKKQQHKDRILMLLRDVGLEEVLHYRVGGDTFTEIRNGGKDEGGGYGTRHAYISGGQRRRLSVALELLTDPKVLLMDEPTSGLDASNALQLMKMLNAFCASGRTLILSIHQPRMEIFNMFDRLVLMTRGEILSSGIPHQVIRDVLMGVDYLYTTSVSPGDLLLDIVSSPLYASCVEKMKVAYQRSFRNVLLQTAPLNVVGNASSLTAADQIHDSYQNWSDLFSVFHGKNSQLSSSTLNKREFGRENEFIFMIYFRWFWVLVHRAIFCVFPQDMMANIWNVLIISVTFGLLAMGMSSAYINASVLYCTIGFMEPIIASIVVVVYFKLYFVYLKDFDVVPVSPFIFCLAISLVLVTLFAVPGLIGAIVALMVARTNSLSFVRLVSVLCVIEADNINTTIFSLMICAVTSYWRIHSQEVVVFALMIFTFFSGFFISPTDAPIYLAWIFYVSPFYYSFSGSLRILISGLPASGCSSISQPVAENLLCQLGGGDSFLRIKGFSNIDIALNVGILMTLTCISWLMFWFFVSMSISNIVRHRSFSRLETLGVKFQSLSNPTMSPRERWHTVVLMVQWRMLETTIRRQPARFDDVVVLAMQKLLQYNCKITSILTMFNISSETRQLNSSYVTNGIIQTRV